MQRKHTKWTLGLCLWGALAGPAMAETVYGRVYDTMDNGRIYANTRVVLSGKPSRETVTDQYGQYRFENVPRGAYLIRLHAQGKAQVTGRLIVQESTTIANLDFGKLEDPDHAAEY